MAFMKNASPARRSKYGLRSRRQRGFSLVEVLISVLLLSLGVLGLIGLQARTMEMSGEAEDRNRAAMLADDLASRMWMAHSVSLSGAQVTEWQDFVEDPAKSGLANATGTVAAVAGRTDAVDVTITWRAPTRADSDNSTLRTRIILSRDPAP